MTVGGREGGRKWREGGGRGRGGGFPSVGYSWPPEQRTVTKKLHASRSDSITCWWFNVLILSFVGRLTSRYYRLLVA